MTDSTEEIKMKNLDSSMLTNVAGNLAIINLTEVPVELAELIIQSRKYLKLLLDKAIEDLANNND